MEKTRALVTGGIRGIGLEITKALLAQDIEVIVTTRSARDLPKDLKATVFEIDLADASSADILASKFGDAAIFINNAGCLNGCTLDQYDEKMQNHILNLNLITPIHLMWRFGQLMASRGGGRIVNNTSIAAHIGHPDVWYGATKAGLLNATKSIARALGPQGVICNAVAPAPQKQICWNIYQNHAKQL